MTLSHSHTCSFATLMLWTIATFTLRFRVLASDTASRLFFSSQTALAYFSGCSRITCTITSHERITIGSGFAFRPGLEPAAYRLARTAAWESPGPKRLFNMARLCWYSRYLRAAAGASPICPSSLAFGTIRSTRIGRSHTLARAARLTSQVDQTDDTNQHVHAHSRSPGGSSYQRTCAPGSGAAAFWGLRTNDRDRRAGNWRLGVEDDSRDESSN
ncbi:hypothetical protein OBBRIDRAFT_257043 [Obba rivulosa]|uniref:Uncharacterized protein n=1 Tax=Obba rivulosa TaxID=1052685 RepID=A0A8E2DKV4_9APHY|nr:hypothetical protein OBBRIDRAFT_257043 [Obba rivulosa]